MREDPRHRGKSLLGPALAVYQAEGPVGNLRTAAMPFVGKGENDKPRKAQLERRPRLPLEQFRLMGFALADRVHAGFAQDQGEIAADCQQMGHVAPEVIFPMQIYVEAEQVEETQLQVLSRRIVAIGEKPLRVDILAEVVQLGQKAAHPAHPMPSDQVGTNLVAQAVGEDHITELAHLGGQLRHRGANLARGRLRIQERQVGRPQRRDHQAQFAFGRQFEHPGRWRHVSPDHVDTQLPQIHRAAFRFGVELATRIGRERAVGDTPGIELPLAVVQVFVAGDQSCHRVCRLSIAADARPGSVRSPRSAGRAITVS